MIYDIQKSETEKHLIRIVEADDYSFVYQDPFRQAGYNDHEIKQKFGCQKHETLIDMMQHTFYNYHLQIYITLFNLVSNCIKVIPGHSTTQIQI